MEHRIALATEPPEVLAGYAVVRRLDPDGSGERLVVRHPRIGREELMRVLDAPADSAVRRRVLDALATTTAVEHPSLVPCYGLGDVDGTLFLTTQLVDGVSLSELSSAPSPEDLVEGVHQVAAALDALHDAGAVHAGVTAENVIALSQRGPRGHVCWMLVGAGLAAALSASGAGPSPDDDVRDLARLVLALGNAVDPVTAELLRRYEAPRPGGPARRASDLALALEEGLAAHGAAAGEGVTTDGTTGSSTLASSSGALPRRRGLGRRRGAAAALAGLGLVLALVAGDERPSPGAAAAAAPASASQRTPFPARVGLPAGTVPGEVVLDAAGDAWVADDNGDQLLRVRPDGIVTAIPVPVAGDSSVLAGDRQDPVTSPVPRYSTSTYSRRQLSATVEGDVWYSAFTQLGRVSSDAAAVDMPGFGDLGRPGVTVPDGRGGVWVSLALGGLVEVSRDGWFRPADVPGADGRQVDVSKLLSAPAGDLYLSADLNRAVLVRRASGAVEQVQVPKQTGFGTDVSDMVVDPDGTTLWVLDHGTIHRIGAEGAESTTVATMGVLGGGDLTWGPEGDLYWIDDPTGRIAKLDPRDLDDFTEYLPVPDGATARAMTATPDQLLLTIMAPDGSASLVALDGHGQAVDGEVTADQKAVVLSVLETYTAQRGACAETSLPKEDEEVTSEAKTAGWASFFTCLEAAIGARDAALSPVQLPPVAAAAKAEVLQVDEDFRAVLNSGESLSRYDLMDRTAGTGHAVDRLKTALGEPRTGTSY